VSSSLISLIPVELAEPGDQFISCPKTIGWIRGTFLSQDSPLYNVEHDHLNSAHIGLLWTSAPNMRQMRVIVGTAETGNPPNSLSGKWAKARWSQQTREWFGSNDLDFIITLSAPYFAGASEAEQCAIIEHELYHCAQRLDDFGLPKFRKDGRPVFGIRGHDVEEFVGVVRRYGVGAAAGDTQALVRAAQKKPEIAPVEIAGMCGTCK
jgi:hypothetical protein